MKVPFFDLKNQYLEIQSEVETVLKEIFQDQAFILGPRVKGFEEKMEERIGVKHAIGVASGSDALFLSLKAVGVQSGDEVITTPYTFFATAGAISGLGAIPVFVDITPETFLMDPEKVEAAMTPKARAIIPVHLFGQMTPMAPLRSLCEDEDLFLIEDAAQALGAKEGEDEAGTVGSFGCFSFFPTKNLGGAGDGGMVITQDDSLADLVRRLRVHGSSVRYQHTEIGVNSRLDSLQAAILEIKLRYLGGWNLKRQENASLYGQLFRDADLEERVSLPIIREGCTHVFHQYVVRTSQRDELRKFLLEHNVGSEVYYPIPLHLQPAYKDLGYKEGDFPHSEEAARSSLALPVFPELMEEQQAYVVEVISKFFKNK